MRRTIFLLLALSFVVTTLYAASVQPRVIQQFTTGWRFLQSDATDAQQPDFNDTTWKPVTLPHDWGDIAVTATAEGLPPVTIHLTAVPGSRPKGFRSF
jgi:hypothetical protein